MTTSSCKSDNFTEPSAEAMIGLMPQKYDEDTPAVGVFLIKYKHYPSILRCSTDTDDIRFHIPSIKDYLNEKFQDSFKEYASTETYHQRSKQVYASSNLTDLSPGLMVFFGDCEFESDIENPNKLVSNYEDGYYHVTTNIRFLYLPEHKQLAQELFVEIKKLIVFASISCTLQMVCRNQHCFYLNGIKIKKPIITDIGLHYGKKFVPIHEKILKNLNQKQGKGIVLLHGVPGSGKTHYIRYLIQEIKNKTLIYIPPDMAKEISSPAFLPFLMEYPDSILIIEDAENIIKDRNETSIPSQAVANLLNLSDGLLGDAMYQQIIATFNCDLKTIDPALLRKGRLIANYEFNELDLNATKLLSEKLGFPSDQIDRPMTLAEIYNQNETETNSLD